jgi:hypothetical protein
VVRGINGLGYTSCKVYVVVFEHYHVVKPHSVVGAAANSNRFFLEYSHAGCCFACVEHLGFKPLSLSAYTLVCVAMPLMRCMMFKTNAPILATNALSMHQKYHIAFFYFRAVHNLHSTFINGSMRLNTKSATSTPAIMPSSFTKSCIFPMASSGMLDKC